MKILVIFTITVSAAYGWVDWLDLHVGNTQVPISGTEARNSGWKIVLKDNELKISWYQKNNDPSLFVAYDGRNNVAGLRINQLKTGVEDGLGGVYENCGLFEETTIGKKKYFSATVLFSPTSVLRSGGRRKLAGDDVALGVFVKKGNEYQQIDREGCHHADTGSVEQGCQPEYGLVFSDFDSSSSCDDLSPFYTMWDTQDRGNLIGFGQFTLTKNIPNSKTVSEDTFKMLFPNRPDCLSLAARKGLSAVEIWLSKNASSMSSCDSGTGSWNELHCDHNMRSMYTIL